MKFIFVPLFTALIQGAYQYRIEHKWCDRVFDCTWDSFVAATCTSLALWILS